MSTLKNWNKTWPFWKPKTRNRRSYTQRRSHKLSRSTNRGQADSKTLRIWTKFKINFWNEWSRYRFWRTSWSGVDWSWITRRMCTTRYSHVRLSKWCLWCRGRGGWSSRTAWITGKWRVIRTSAEYDTYYFYRLCLQSRTLDSTESSND